VRLNTAALTPNPSANVAMMTSVNPGRAASARNALPTGLLSTNDTPPAFARVESERASAFARIALRQDKSAGKPAGALQFDRKLRIAT
jgi:hypothetical protein